MKKSTFYIIGGFLILLGIAMFLFGVSMFTYQGNRLSPFVSKLGMYSFLYWLPTIGVGIVITIIGTSRPKKSSVENQHS
jgi:hypothetical protein